MRYRSVALSALGVCLAAPALGQDITLELLDTLDLSELSVVTPSVYVGTYPVSIAWDGSSLYIGGADATGSATQTEIAEIVNALDGPGSWSVRAVGGSLATTPALRSRPGLDWDDALGLLATHDLGTDALPDQIQVFNRTLPGDPLALVTASASGSGVAGPGWDAGPGGVGFTRSDLSVGPIVGVVDYRAIEPTNSQAVGFLGPIGFDPVTLTGLYNAALGGPVIDTTTGQDALWRDVDFHPDGAIAARATQDLVIAERDATNSVTTVLRIDDASDQALVTGNNAAWINGATCLTQDVVVWNDRGPGCLGTLVEALRFTNRDGTDATFVIEDNAGVEITAWPRSNCLYDFAWDEAGERLFVLESLTRLVYVLEVCDAGGPVCLPDINGDGVLDNGDIGSFVTLFIAGDIAADFNGDGIIDNGDIGSFVGAFQAGC